MPTAIIFDFDGVIADSEVRANMTLAESLTAIGLPTSYDECLRDYYGHNWQETQRRIEARLGGPLPRAIASSSSPAYIAMSLDRFGLAHHFGPHVYSADGWDRGKPHPDIYLAAAKGIGADPAACLAIEDSPTGAQAALAAGMTVVGFCGAGHIVDRGAHGAMLRAVGVHHIAQDFADIATI